VENFVYFSEDPAVECHLLAECCKADFMGIVEWFLGMCFFWHLTSFLVAVHLNQSGFASNLVKSFFCDSWDPTPMAMPYQSDIPIDAIAPSTEEDNSPALKQRKEAYQSLMGRLVVSLAPLVLILRRSILSCLCITTNPLGDI
jgi:hypothetical protein